MAHFEETYRTVKRDWWNMVPLVNIKHFLDRLVVDLVNV